MEDTSGFYKLEDGQLLYGPNSVENRTYQLFRLNKDFYTYPVEGWYWFNSIEEAHQFFGIIDEQPEQ